MEQISDEGRHVENQVRDYQSEFEHLSCYDPDDEFLQQSHSIVLLQSILGNQNLEQTSEYSVIDDSDDVISLSSRHSIGSVRSIRFLKSLKQAEDTIVKKIIYYIGLFSTEVREMLDKVNNSSGGEIREEDINLQKLTAEFVEVVLRILERYDLIKLCLILCNRFELNSKLGQYVVSSCLKYQNLQNFRFTDQFQAFRKLDSFLVERQKKSALIAHEAMHNVLGLISSKYLKLKDYNQALTSENSLGIQNYRLMLSLGFWKKLVYTLNGRMSLQLCLKFNDTANFMLLEERFGSSELTSLWKTLVHFKQAITIIDKCINKNSSTLYKDPFMRYMLTSSQIADELAMNQLLEIPEIRDCHDLIKFLIIPDCKTTVVQKKQNDVLNNIYADRTVVNEDQVKVQRITGQVTLDAQEVITKRFTKIDQNSGALLGQLLLAFVLMSWQRNDSCKISNIVKEEAQFKQLIQIYEQAVNCFNTKSMIQTALLASVNMTGLGSDDYFSNEVVDDGQNLFLQYQGTHVLASVHSPLTAAIQEMQRKLFDKQFKEQFIIQGEQLANQLHKDEDQQLALEKLGFKLKLNSRRFDINNLSTPNYQCAMVVDMDLQFHLVPQKWVQTELTSRISKYLEKLYNELMKIETEKMKNVSNWKQAALLQGQMLSQQFAKNRYTDRVAVCQDLQLKVDYAKLVAGVDAKIVNLIDQMLGGVILKVRTAQTKPMQLVDNRYALKDINSSLFLFSKHQGSLSLRDSAYSHSNIISATTMLEQVNQILLGRDKVFAQLPFNGCDFLVQRAANLFAIAGRQESFIDLAGLLVHKCKDKDKRKLISSFISHSRAQAHFKNGLITEGCFELLAQYKKSGDLLMPEEVLNIIEYAFYTLMPSFGPVVLPERAMGVLDSWYDLQTEKAKANAQAGIEADFNEEQVDDDYYDEWDKPEIAEVKQIQLQKRPSQQQEKYLPVLTYKQEAKFVASKPNAISLLKQVLDIALIEFKSMNSENFSEENSHRWFDIMITTCVNIDVTQFNNQLKKWFLLLDDSPLSDYYYDLLLQYTNEPKQLRKMFNDTEDELKYTFFAKSPYLVKVTANVELKDRSKNFDLDRWLCRRVRARRVIRKCLHQRVLSKGNDSLAKFKPLFVRYGIDLDVLDIQQGLPNMYRAIAVLDDLKNKQLALQELLLVDDSQKIKLCFDIQFVIQKQVQVRVVFDELISCINNFVKGKAQILKSFADLGDVDVELVEGIENARLASETIDCETKIWYQCSQAKKEQLQKEDESVRASRMVVKWQSWNTLAQRKARIASRLQKYKDLA